MPTSRLVLVVQCSGLASILRNRNTTATVSRQRTRDYIVEWDGPGDTGLVK